MMTTVISVNQTVSDQISDIGVGDDGGMLRPETAAAITRTNSNRSANDTKDILIKGKKLGHRRVKDGEVTYKKFETTQLMGSIQLGIQQSVGNLGCQEDRDLLHEDFYTVETVVFSRDGTLQKTPAHNYTQFKVRKPVKFIILFSSAYRKTLETKVSVIDVEGHYLLRSPSKCLVSKIFCGPTFD